MSATVTQPVAVEQYRREFEEHIPLVYWIARKRLLHEDGSVPPDYENAVANAVGTAWKHFPAIRERHADRPVRDAVCLAIRRGVGRVRHGEALGWSKPHRGYRDAMNGRPRELPEDAPAPTPPEWRIWLEDMLTSLLEDPRDAVATGPVRELAEILSYGIPHKQAKALLRWGDGHYDNVLRELKRQVRRVLGERVPA